MFFILRTARLHRREWTVAIELLAMVDYVTDTLKTSRLKKVDMIDMTVANATSKMLPTGWQPSCSTVDRLVGGMRNMLRVAKRAASSGAGARQRHACARLSDAAALYDASVLELHKTPAAVDNAQTESDWQVSEM